MSCCPSAVWVWSPPRSSLPFSASLPLTLPSPPSSPACVVDNRMAQSDDALLLFDADDTNEQEVTTHLKPVQFSLPQFPSASLSPSTSKTHLRLAPQSPGSTSPQPSPTKAQFGFGAGTELEEVSVVISSLAQVERGAGAQSAGKQEQRKG